MARPPTPEDDPTRLVPVAGTKSRPNGVSGRPDAV